MIGLLVAGLISLGAVDSVKTDAPVEISLEQAIHIALSENETVKIADKEIERTQYAKKGTYAALFPQIDFSGSYQRTLKKQKMYIDMQGMSPDGIEVGRWNTWSAGVSAAMPLVNAQVWESIKISAQDVEMAVEKARSSRLDMVTQVKTAFYAVLLAKEVREVYREVYENALVNCNTTEMRYNAQKASELDLVRAKANLANAIPNLYDSDGAVEIALWQLKAVMGLNLEEEIGVSGSLHDYAKELSRDLYSQDYSLENNSALKQLEIQAEQLALSVKAQQYAYIPSLALAFNYNISATDNTYNFSQYNWSPYSFVGLSLNIPIFSGGKRLNSVRQSKTMASELELQRQSTERQLKIALRQCLKSMETSTNSYFAADDALATAQKAYAIAEQSYNVGRSTLTDLNDAQLVLTQSELGVSQAIYSYIVAKAQLEQQLGYDFKMYE